VTALALALVAAAGALRPAAARENRARVAEIEVTGPVSELVLSLGAAGETRIEGGLLAGERVRLAVPLPARGAEAGPPPRITWATGGELDLEGGVRGSARFVRWSDDATRLDLLPPGLLARPRPPVAPEEIELPLSVLALLPACFVLGLATRARRATSILLSLAGAALVLGLAARRGERGAAEIEVLEIAPGSALGLEVRASHAAASVDSAELAATALAVDPEEERVVWTGSFEARAAWRASAPGAALYRLHVLDAAAVSLTRAENRGVPLAEAWLREEGEWTARGAWGTGAPLPDARPGPPPPGWLAAGLPQGVPVLLGRLARAPGEDRDAWVRQTGLD